MARSSSSVKVTEEDFVHVGPGTLAGAFLRRFWHPVYCSDDLPVGVPKPIRILGEDFTLYRGAAPSPLAGEGRDGGDAPPPQSSPTVGGGGKPHVLGFRCAHRGNQLSLGWVEGDSIRCYYHGWRYDATGQCDRQPHEEHAFCQKIKIPSYPVQEYVGLIFLYIGPEPVPPLPRYPRLEREGHVAEADMKVLPYNYFQSMENNVDSGHVAFVHRRFHRAEYVEDLDTVQAVRIRARETDYGIENARAIGDGSFTYAHFLMPNIHCIVIPGRGSWNDPRHHYSWRTPIADDRTLWFNTTAEPADDYDPRTREPSPDLEAYARRVLAGEESIHELPKNRHITNMQDCVSQWGQGTIADRRNDHLGKSDFGVILMRQIYKRELQALAEGRPLKQWTNAEEAISTVY